MRVYLDSSSLVKLVQREAGSDALRRFLRRHRGDNLVTSTFSRAEVVRAVFPGGPRAVGLARRQLGRIDQIAVTSELLDRAASLAPSARLRSLDAIHLASAQVVEQELRSVVTYDQRMATAATNLGLAVEAPG